MRIEALKGQPIMAELDESWSWDLRLGDPPPRVTKLAGEIDLQAGCALDLTMLDKENN